MLIRRSSDSSRVAMVRHGEGEDVAVDSSPRDPGADSVWQAGVVIGGLTLVTVVWASRAFAKGVR